MTILPSLRVEVAGITSASGRVTVANADNTKAGAGALWDYSTKLGSDNALTTNEVSLPRTLKFNNPNNEAFTVTLNVIGNFDRAALAASSGSSSSGGGGSGSSTTTNAVTNALYSLAYNPLLNSITSQVIKP